MAGASGALNRHGPSDVQPRSQWRMAHMHVPVMGPIEQRLYGRWTGGGFCLWEGGSSGQVLCQPPPPPVHNQKPQH